MANRLKLGGSCVDNGRRGDVRLNVGVTPEVKTELVKLAVANGVSLRALIGDAIDFYLDAVRAERDPSEAT